MQATTLFLQVSAGEKFGSREGAVSLSLQRLSGYSFALGVMEPELSTPCGKGRKGSGSVNSENRASVRQDVALLRTGGLTPIMPLGNVHFTAHAHSTGNLHQESRDQASAPRAGVGLQPPTSAENSDGADGADQALHRGHRRRMPPPFPRAGESWRSLRSRERRAVAERIAGEELARRSAARQQPPCKSKGPLKVPPSPRMRLILHR